MSVLEMQLAVIKEVSELKDEKALKEILEYLSKIPSKKKGRH
ncbi:hypothetical protein [Niabella ginsengisoli]|nr:hypothetical protein [Niabella ginsengisoli]